MQAQKVKQNQTLIKRDLKYLDLLAQVATDMEPVSNASLAAMIVYKNQVIAIGTNQRKSHPLQAEFSNHEEKIWLHAEISAIIRALKDLSHDQLEKSTIYICRVKKDKSWALARPCPGCWDAINAFKLNRVVWSVDSEQYEEWSESDARETCCCAHN